MQINKSKEEFRKDWFEVKYCPLSQSELEVKSKNYWIKKDFSLDIPFDKTNNEHRRNIYVDNIIEETIEIPKEIINTKNKVVMINKIDKAGVLLHSKLCLFGKTNAVYKDLVNNKKEKTHKIDR